MQAYRVETKIQNGKITIEDLPFEDGENVEIIILSAPKPDSENRYPLRGTVYTYIAPTEPVASDDWDVSQ